MDAYERSNRIEAAALSRVTAIYAQALTTALKNKRAFLRKIKDVDEGRIKPPQYYVDRDEVDKWREGFIKQLIRQEGIIDGIVEELNRAGVEAADVVKRSLVDIYAANRTEAAKIYAQGAKKHGMDISFAVHNRREIEVSMAKNESPFSKIAYQNLGQNTVIRKRLQAELAQAAALGESQRKIIERIRKVTGMAAYQAKRVAQTERTRVQSQARWMVGEEARAAGVRVINEWSARMVNTRDSHAALDGVKKPQGEPFETIWGNELDYPGDPKAPAREVINCHCVLIPDVE